MDALDKAIWRWERAQKELDDSREELEKAIAKWYPRLSYGQKAAAAARLGRSTEWMRQQVAKWKTEVPNTVDNTK